MISKRKRGTKAAKTIQQYKRDHGLTRPKARKPKVTRVLTPYGHYRINARAVLKEYQKEAHK